MAAKIPLVLYAGVPGQLQSGDTLTLANVSSLYGVTYASLDDRLAAIESSLMSAGLGPTVGIASYNYVFTNPVNTMYYMFMF